jgi:hypothetical protein
MADLHRYIVLRESRVDAVNDWLQDHPTLDIRGGGGLTFGPVKLALLTDPDDGSVVRGRLCSWKLQPEWVDILIDRMESMEWIVNLPIPTCDFSHYGRSNWSLEQVLIDVTRKPFPVKIVPVEE